MADLSLVLRYSDMYTDNDFASPSFSYGLPTPASSADFSNATSRRQSIQSGNGSSALASTSSYSQEGLTAHLSTPPHLQASFDSTTTCSTVDHSWETESSPGEDQNRSDAGWPSTANGEMFRDPFTLPDAYLQLGEANRRTESRVHRDIFGLKAHTQPAVNWLQSCSSGFDETYDHFASERISETSWLDPSGLDHPGYLSSIACFGSGTDNGAVADTHSPQTVSPQETFFSPTTLFTPSTPTCQPLGDAFVSPTIKAEFQMDESITEDYPSPDSSIDRCPSLRASRTRARQSKLEDCKPQLSLFEIRSNRRRRWSSSELPPNTKRISSSSKVHRCMECDMKFDRPEHCNRHKETLEHRESCLRLGLPVSFRDPKPFKCEIPGCGQAVTRRDNLKPHYQKTHFFSKWARDKDGMYIRDKDGKKKAVKKRNLRVSRETARLLGLEDKDSRPPYGRAQSKSSKPLEYSDDSDSDSDGQVKILRKKRGLRPGLEQELGSS